MNQDQEKPKRKLNLNGTAIGITAIVIGILIYAVYVIVTGNPQTSCICHDSGAYGSIKAEVENAVTAYTANSSHPGEIPVLSGTYTNDCCSNCSVINMSALLTVNGGSMKTMPTGLANVSAGYDNCNGSGAACKTTNHYVWIVDINGNVSSTCVGNGCKTNNSCYQGVWP